MDERRNIDDALANQTDALLSDPSSESLEAEPELQELISVVRQLRDVISPEQAPPPEFEARLRRRLDQELDQRRFLRSRAISISPLARLTALAAALFIVVGVVALLVASNEHVLLSGAAAVGGEATGLLLVVGFFIAIAVYLYWRSRR
ncbi:MAG: hypothetical protein SNJ59_11250 [Aggregatilineales bacterium]